MCEKYRGRYLRISRRGVRRSRSRGGRGRAFWDGQGGGRKNDGFVVSKRVLGFSKRKKKKKIKRITKCRRPDHATHEQRAAFNSAANPTHRPPTNTERDNTERDKPLRNHIKVIQKEPSAIATDGKRQRVNRIDEIPAPLNTRPSLRYSITP